MKLLIYGDIGGSGGYIRYCKGLLDTGHVPSDIEVWFICSRQLYEKIAPLDPKVKIIAHPWILSRFRVLRYLWHLWIYPRLVRKIKPDVEFYPSGQLRVYYRKAKTITTCHNLLLFDNNELSEIKDEKKLKYFLNSKKVQTKAFQKSEGVIFLSSYSQEIVTQEIGKIKDSTVISHGLDKDFLQQEARSYEINGNVRLLYVSPYFTYKHQLEVIKAIQILLAEGKVEVELNLIGGGEESAVRELENYVNKENLQNYINVKGNIPYKELKSYYSNSDIFIFASSCETFGITLLEAMGARLPIACSDRSGLSEIVRDAGVYFNPEDPESIANSIKTLSSDMEMRKKCGELGFKYAHDYTWSKCASETFDYIKKINRDI